MSDLPPVPPQQPYNQPPQYPQHPGAGPGGAYAAPAQKTNGLAIASLIVGIVGFCIPFAGGLLAIILGGLGLGSAKRTHSGKGLAITGLILGIVSLGIWLLFSGAIFAAIKGTQINRDVAGQFIRDLSAGNVQGAMNNADPASIKQEELAEFAKTIQAVGQVQDVTTLSTQVVNQNADLAGVISFPNNVTKPFEMKQTKINDQWKVTYVKLIE